MSCVAPEYPHLLYPLYLHVSYWILGMTILLGPPLALNPPTFDGLLESLYSFPALFSNSLIYYTHYTYMFHTGFSGRRSCWVRHYSLQCNGLPRPQRNRRTEVANPYDQPCAASCRELVFAWNGMGWKVCLREDIGRVRRKVIEKSRYLMRCAVSLSERWQQRFRLDRSDPHA